jgi:hypothetical protein
VSFSTFVRNEILLFFLLFDDFNCQYKENLQTTFKKFLSRLRDIDCSFARSFLEKHAAENRVAWWRFSNKRAILQKLSKIVSVSTQTLDIPFI